MQIEKMAQLQEKLEQHQEKGYLLRHSVSKRWVPVQQHAVIKEVTSGNYSQWMGPYDSVQMATTVAADIAIKSNEAPQIQNEILRVQIDRIRKLYLSKGIKI